LIPYRYISPLARLNQNESFKTMSTTHKQTLVVFGATGQQGGSVVRAILKDPQTASQFHVKAVTRDTSKPSAKSLVDLGAETVTADLNDKESLRAAMKGAHAVFAVTNFWEKGDADWEIQQGKNVADISKEVGVQHLIWSSLLNVTELSKGKFSGVHHFDSKATIEQYIKSIGVPASFFLAGFYMGNIPGSMMRKTSPEGAPEEWTFSLPVPPSTPVPLVAIVEDTGKFVKAMLLKREEVLGKRVLGATAYYTMQQIVDEFTEVTGKKGRFVQSQPDEFKRALAQGGLNAAGQEEFLQNMFFMKDFGYYGGESLDWSHKLVGEPLTTWKQFVSESSVFNATK